MRTRAEMIILEFQLIEELFGTGVDFFCFMGKMVIKGYPPSVSIIPKSILSVATNSIKR